jgi:hypothetical protein
MTDRPVITIRPVEPEEPAPAPAEPTAWRPKPTLIPTKEAAVRFRRAERTVRSRALDHPVADMVGGDWWFRVERMAMLRANDTGALDDDVHGRMVPRVLAYYDTGSAPRTP